MVPYLLAAAMVVAHLWAERAAVGDLQGLPLDDSYIHLQFATSLAEGDGLAYRPGRWIGGSTGPLWTALLSVAILLPGSAVLWAKVFGVALLFLTLQGVGRLARAWGLGAAAAILAMSLVALTDWMTWSALSAMEIALFAALQVWGLALHQRELDAGRGAASLLLLSLGVLCRPEGVLLLGLALIERAVADRSPQGEPRFRRWLLWTALCLVTVAPTLLFYWWVGGSPLPTAFAMKSAGDPRGFPAVRDLWRAAEVLYRPLPWATLFLSAGLLALARRRAGGSAASWLPALWIAVLPAAYSSLASAGRPANLGNFGRYAFPLLPLVALLGVAGMALLWREASGRSSSTPAMRRAVCAGLVLLVLAPTVLAAVRGVGRYALNVHNVQSSDVALARWVARELPPDAVLAVQDIGAVGWLTPNPLIDLVGLVNPEILPYRSGALVGDHPTRLEGLMTFVRDRGASHLAVFPRSYGGEAALRAVAPDLREVLRLAVPRNLTMAADELVLYRFAGPGPLLP